MKIILDAYQHTPHITGTDRTAHNFLKELQNIDKTNQYYVLCSKETFIPEVLNSPNFRVTRNVLSPWRDPFSRIINKVWRRVFPYFLKSLRPDVYFSFHNMRLPGKKIAKRMLTSNLDLIPLILEEYHKIDRLSKSERRNEYQKVMNLADGVMSISHFSKRELCDTLDVSPEKVRVIHMAVDPHFHRSKTSVKEINGISIPTSFILTMGGTEPRKNVVTVVEAYKKLPENLRKNLPLLVVGGEWHGHTFKAFQSVEGVKTLGYVDDKDLVKLHSQATIFVFASYYEGFGLPVLEAMACGAPVISATGTSLDEIIDSAVIAFKPTDVEALIKAMEHLLNDDKERQRLITAGYKQAAKFSWGKSAEQLHDLFMGN